MKQKPEPHFPPPTFDDAPASQNRVRVTKPNEVGEIISKVIPAKDFRPKLPTKPRADERKITIVSRGTSSGPTGRSVVYMTKVREAEIEYWRAFDHILTPAERRQISSGKSSSVLRPIPPAWRVGDRMYVASNMEAEVVEVTDSFRGYGTVFKIHDYRVMYLKRGVIGPSHLVKTDDEGYAPPITKEQEEKSRLESAYTTSASQSIDEAGGVMDEEAHRRIHIDQPAGNALRGARQRMRVSRADLERRLATAKAKHRLSTVRMLERKLASLEKKDDDPGGLRAA